MNSSPKPTTEPIFILGVAPRSGTNFLSDLLCLHPDCAAPIPIREDYFLYYADHLERYLDAVSSRWLPGWAVDPAHKEALRRHMGNGLITYLQHGIGPKQLVTKTPSVRNLQHFFRYFPKARLLILVRDGRAVVESLVRSFGTSYEWAARTWAHGAHTIVNFQRTAEGAAEDYLLVRYEELWQHPKDTLARIFAYAGLDSDKYDFDRAVNLPVRGSSVFRGHQRQALHWEPVEKTPDFNPTLRWQSWSRATHDRFNWIAGCYLRPLGYEPVPGESLPLVSWLWNWLLDLRWGTQAALRTIPSGIRALPKALRRAFVGAQWRLDR